MSGSYIDAAGPTIAADAAAVAAGVAQVVGAGDPTYQAEAEHFIMAHGVAVVGGHPPVEGE